METENRLTEPQKTQTRRELYFDLHDSDLFACVSMTGQNQCDINDAGVDEDGHYTFMRGEYRLNPHTGWGPAPVEVQIHGDLDAQTAITLLEKVIAMFKQYPDWFENEKLPAPSKDNSTDSPF